jgi:hypothetical protein
MHHTHLYSIELDLVTPTLEKDSAGVTKLKMGRLEIP